MSTEKFRPPSIPLVTHTPYFSIWCMANQLADVWSTHWTGHSQSMCGLIRIDGSALRFMGLQPTDIPVLTQKSVTVSATTTTFEFEEYGIALSVEFLSPLLPKDLDLLTRPVTYVNFTLHATDGNEHSVEIYFDNTAELVVNDVNQKVLAAQHNVKDIQVLSFKSVEQLILGKKGDDVRIDWGIQYLAIPEATQGQTFIGATELSRNTFAHQGILPNSNTMKFPRAVNDDWPGISAVLTFNKVSRYPVSRHLLLAYDELYSVEYFHRKLKPYWKRNGLQIDELLIRAESEYVSVRNRCNEFNRILRQELNDRGGTKYSKIAELAFRQCLSAHAIVQDVDGTLLMFSKENSSNGCMGTIDVTYPGAPFFLYFNSDLLKAQIVPVLNYAARPSWKFPFAPHDLGIYPQANGQVYGGGEHSEQYQMPVEECGNMLILTAAVCKIQNKTDLADQHWEILQKWAHYILLFGLNPSNQLCTDDFAGHLAHNANLSLKAIMAIGAFAKLCELRMDKTQADFFYLIAQKMAAKWLTLADDGDHYRLAFDRKGSWSQKYNLVWQQLFNFNIFPTSVAQKEINYYLKHQNKFGLPLDYRADYTKADWIVWTACLTKTKQVFQAFITPLYDFLNVSVDRVPFSDLYDTKTGRQVGFHARSVVGGVFLPLLKPF
ncbi:unnamed protein product [Rotaria socialis]|uniref:Glutaminase n=1 Tax=Rotaria socialis TaxID=392032 RepID=A0A820W2P5_9BILA|nr:unnamed protein product [Rotaria socialis]CAF3360557.1 unnamed protein product [Rotaria socialis]CAF4456383.1 unnamed protein product [Rotaria socialis]CAF4509811.1 unnamed protein product [Rotaria socialis]